MIFSRDMGGLFLTHNKFSFTENPLLARIFLNEKHARDVIFAMKAEDVGLKINNDLEIKPVTLVFG